VVPYHLARADAIAAFEREYVSTVLKITKGNVSAAARLALMDRTTLYRLAARHGVSGPSALAA
jgi:transcriptional regulator of acetoin/glycerol metabolism